MEGLNVESGEDPLLSINICADCQFPIRLCNWLQKGCPVLGWQAEKATVEGQETYRITQCPQYVAPTLFRLLMCLDGGD